MEAPKHGNDIPEMNRFTHRVYESILTAFNNVDGGGNYLGKEIKSTPDAYTKSIHNLMGLVTGRAADRQESRGCPLRWQSVGHAGHRRPRTDRIGDVCG